MARLLLCSLMICLVLLGVNLERADAAKRVALVIGNSNYESVARLPNPRNDALDVAAAFGRLDFQVTLELDLDYGGLRKSLRDFGRVAHGADMAVVYFAGHGIEVARSNYLIPVDAKLNSNLDVEYEAITLGLVLRSVAGAKGLRLVLLDACRNNPFSASMSIVAPKRAVGRGLSRIEPAVGTLVSYAAKEGTTAEDGGGRNSPYTDALLQYLERPGMEINFLFRNVRDRVIEETNGLQEPFVYGSLPRKKIYLKPPQKVAVSRPVPVKQKKIEPQHGLGRDVSTAEIVFWNTIKDSRDPDVLSAYLAEYPNGKFARLARILIAKHTKPEKKETVASPPEPQPEQTVAAINPDVKISDPSLIAEIQRRLYELQLEPGPADGIFGSKTLNAAREFQRSAGLPTTERPTLGLLKALRDKQAPANWAALAFLPSQRSVLKRVGLSSRYDVEKAIRRACGNCANVLTFAGDQCAVLALSNRGWGWAVRSGERAARETAMQICGAYGGKCQVKTSLCANVQ